MINIESSLVYSMHEHILFACKQMYIDTCTCFQMHYDGNVLKISGVCFKVIYLMTNQRLSSNLKRNTFLTNILANATIQLPLLYNAELSFVPRREERTTILPGPLIALLFTSDKTKRRARYIQIVELPSFPVLMTLPLLPGARPGSRRLHTPHREAVPPGTPRPPWSGNSPPDSQSRSPLISKNRNNDKRNVQG